MNITIKEREEAKLKEKAKKNEKKQAKAKKKMKEYEAKQKELKAKQKEMKVKQKELKADKPVLAGKAIQSPTADLSVFPNPTRQLTNIQLNLAKKGNVKVDILNVSGQVVQHLVNDTLDKGLHQFQWNSDNQPAGSYFVHFNVDGTFVAKQVVVKQ